MESYAELRAELDRIEEQRANLEAALAAARESGRKAVAEQVRELVRAAGFAVEDILELLNPAPTPKRTRTKKGLWDARTPVQRYALRSDPAAVWTFRGKTPAWLAEQMVAVGLDPKSRDNRQHFRDNYMIAV